MHAPGFRLFRVRSPLLAESLLFSTPLGTEMFHFPRCRSEALYIQTPVSRHDSGWVAPFGHPRINACLPLPEAYRSLPRPSSPPDAKASIVRPYALDQKNFWPIRQHPRHLLTQIPAGYGGTRHIPRDATPPPVKLLCPSSLCNCQRTNPSRGMRAEG